MNMDLQALLVPLPEAQLFFHICSSSMFLETSSLHHVFSWLQYRFWNQTA